MPSYVGGRMGSMYKVNRFPICVLVHYLIAKRKGFEDYQAKALAQATAIFYAAMKNRGGRWYSNKKKKYHKKVDPVRPTGKIRFFDRVFESVNINGKEYPVIGGKIITEKDFDKTMRSKFTDEELTRLIIYGCIYINNLDEYILNRPFEIYKRVRDEWRTMEFWEQLMKDERINQYINVMAKEAA